MDDLISRQAAIDDLFELYEYQRDIDPTEAADLVRQGVFLAKKRIERLPSAQPEPHWIPCSERLPERMINGDVETEQEFFVTIKERWPGEEWTYHTDLAWVPTELAWVPGEYIDDFWQTYNDWREGQEVHVIAWMPLPEPYTEDADA